jgi:N-acetylglucosamine-6-phosphate deacetylase
MSIYLQNANLYAPEPLGPGSVLVEDGRITAISPDPEGPDKPSGSPDRVIDLGGAALGPGLIDAHTHGAAGADMMDGGDAVLRMARFFVRHGVTSFVPATVTASFDAVDKAVRGVREAMADTVDGARVLGVHLEGPFISPQRLGAQSPDFCVPPTPDNVARLLDIASDVARIVTLAPEEEGAIEAIGSFCDRGIVVSIGHTVATAAQAEAAFRAGATQVTHMFNGMPPLHHRKPGVVGAALTAKGVRVEIIADGLHLAPTTIRLALAAKGVDGILLMTDSMAATGCGDGEFLLGPMTVLVKDGEARLASGSLAGSTLTMDRALTNLARWTDVGLGGAWQMASLNPARQLGIDHRVGRIAPGYDADLTALDADGSVVLTMVRGQLVY